jgi:hypothetical protein
MHCTINEKGCLSITPQTPLEAFALTQWSANWGKDKPSIMAINAFNDIDKSELVQSPDLFGKYRVSEEETTEDA